MELSKDLKIIFVTYKVMDILIVDGVYRKGIINWFCNIIFESYNNGYNDMKWL